MVSYGVLPVSLSALHQHERKVKENYERFTPSSSARRSSSPPPPPRGDPIPSPYKSHRAHHVVPGYSGHLPGEMDGFGGAPAFHRPANAKRNVVPILSLGRGRGANEREQPFKHDVGGIKIGYMGFVPNASTHVGSSTLGATRTSASLAQRDHTARITTEKEKLRATTSDTSRFAIESASRLVRSSSVGYSGHVPGHAASHSTSFWRKSSQSAAAASPRTHAAHEGQYTQGWRPRSARANARSINLTHTRNITNDAELARAVSGRHHGVSRRITQPNPCSWEGPAAGPNERWPHRSRGTDLDLVQCL